MITLTGGHIQNQGGTAVPNGSISFQLNLDATVIAVPGGLIPASQVVVFQFDLSGDLVQPATIYSNKELNPQNASGLGTFYLVSIYDANGAPLNASPMYWQFSQAANSTVDISQMTPFFSGGNIIFYPSAGQPGGSDTDLQVNKAGTFYGDAHLTWDYTNQRLTMLGLEATFSGTPFGSPTMYVAVGSTTFSEVQQTPIVFAGAGSLAFSGQHPWWLHAQSFAGPLVEINVDETTLGSNLVLTNNAAGSIEATGTALVQGDDGSFNLLNKNAAGDALWMVMTHAEGIMLQFSGASTWSGNLDPATGAWFPGNNSGIQPLGTASKPWASLILNGAPPTASVGQASFGSTVGFGNGSSSTAMTTTTHGTGTGPATPETVVGYIKINVGGTAAWVPYVQ